MTTVSDTLGGILVGLLSAALIRFALGTTAGLPSTTRVAAGLVDIGVTVENLRYADDQTSAFQLLLGTLRDGREVAVRLLGRDSWSARRWTRVWRAAWYHDEGDQYGSDRRQQIEHEALAMLLATRGGTSVAELVAVGTSFQGDSLLVAERPRRSLVDVDPGSIDDALLDAMWSALADLHAAGVAHGSLDVRHVGLDGADRPVFVGSSMP